MKLGALVRFLHALKFQDSVGKMAKIFKTVQVEIMIITIVIESYIFTRKLFCQFERISFRNIHFFNHKSTQEHYILLSCLNEISIHLILAKV